MNIKTILISFLLVTGSLVSAQTPLGYFNSIAEIQNVNDQIFFVANDGVNGDELWVTDGSIRNTHIVKDINPGFQGSSISSLTSYNGELYFSANDNINGSELWKSDGTTEGTQILKNIRANPSSSNPRNLIVFENELYFAASDDGNDSDLWKTDGTAEGTIKMLETNYTGITDLVVVDHYLFIRGYPKALWKLNSTTNQISDLSIDDYYTLDEINSFGNSLICITHTSYRQDIRLYIIDPETDQPTLLKEFQQPQYGDQDIDNFTVVKDELFFSVRTDYGSDPETDVLWKTNGTVEGTVSIKSFSWDRHWSNSYMQNFINFNDELFFRGSSGVSNYLYKSNGSEEGTVLVKEVNVDEYVAPIISNNKLFFASEGRTLWESDGTSTGTFAKFSFIELGTYTDPTVFQGGDGTLYFKGSDQQGLSLWSNSPNSKIEVKMGYSRLKNNSDFQLESKVDSFSIHTFEITNLGDRELGISKVSVTGNSFGLQGEVKNLIAPGESESFDLLHFPYTEGQSKSLLEISNNDLTAPSFRVNLISSVRDTAILSKPDSTVLWAVLTPIDEYETSKLILSNNEIIENQPNQKVGDLSIEGLDNVSYSLIQGIGDRDNRLFNLQGNELIALESFDHESNNLLHIRIKGTENSTNQSYERPFSIEIQNLNEDLNFDDCEESLTSLSYALNDVQYVDENKIIAIGESGVILKSDDSGQHWEKINSGTKSSLSNIQFVDNEVGFIVGLYGILLKTENKGEDWFQLESPTLEYPYPSNLFFINRQTGFAFGADGEIYKTNNGGISWSYQRYGYDDLISMDFINEQVGFICGRSNTLLKTENGGETWRSLDLDDLGRNIRFVDIQFIDETTGYMVGDDGEIFKTQDAGETWTQIGNFPTDYATDIHFIDENNGYATGGWSGSNIYRTNDGGVSWSAQIESNYHQNVIAFDFTQNKGCAVGYGSSLGSTGESGRTIILKDTNDVWKTSSFLKAMDYHAVNFHDNIGLIFSEEAVLRSDDGGLTWSEVLSNKSFYKDHFINDSLGYVLGDSLYKTNNYGLNWSIQGAIESFRDFHFVNATVGYAIDFYGGVYKTTNEGKDWEKSDLGKTGLLSIYFLNEYEGYILGSNGILLNTNDSGVTWTEVNITSKSLWAISFHDQNGLIGGADGALFKTTDGGLSWNEVPTGISRDIRHIKYKTSSKIYIAATDIGSIGGSTTIYESTDSGETWNDLVHTDAIYDMQVLSDAVYLVGERGIALSITNNNAPNIPGLINGPSSTSVNSISNYTTPQSSNTFYKWEVEGDNEIEYSDNESIVTWNEIGTFKLTVTPYNSCGEGNSRTLTVSVEVAPQPSIIGSDTTFVNSQEVYASELGAMSRFSWKLEGAMDYQIINDSSLNVEWSDVEIGHISLIETNIHSGARGYDELYVILLKDEITLGDLPELFPELRVYPNPTSDILNFDFSELNNNIQIRVLDTSGGLIRNLEFKSGHQSIDIRNLNSGVYLIQMVTNEFTSTTRIIKN